MLTDVSSGYLNVFSSQEHGYSETGYWKILIYSKSYLLISIIIMATVVKELRIILMMVMMMMIKFSHGMVNQSKA